MNQTSVGWPNVVGVFHESCPKQCDYNLLESMSDGTKTGPRFWCGLAWAGGKERLRHLWDAQMVVKDKNINNVVECPDFLVGL